jgi:hypothetical protein
MSFSVLGSQHLSISQGGMEQFLRGKIGTVVGSITLDLASAPIPPGEYKIEVGSGVGSVEIYLPRYVQFTIEGTSILGSKEVHDGLDGWKRLVSQLRESLELPGQPPAHSAAPADPSRPVVIHFDIDTGLGSVDIYRI